MLNHKSILIVSEFPAIYHAVIWRRLFETQNNALQIFTRSSSLEPYYDKEFQQVRSPLPKHIFEDYSYKIIPMDSNLGLFVLIKSFFKILSIIHKDNYDFVVLHGYKLWPNLFLAIFANFSGSKLVFRGELQLQKKTWLKFILKKMYLKLFFSRFQYVLISSKLADKFFHSYNINPKNKIYTNVTHDIEFLESKKIGKVDIKGERLRFNIPESHTVSVSVGRFTSRKNHFEILNALVGLENHYHIFIGNGPQAKEMKEFARKNNVNAIFTGYLSELDTLMVMQIADFSIHAAITDPTPKVLIEYTAYGIPCICRYSVECCEDIFKHMESGIIYENENELRLFVKLLIENEQFRNHLSLSIYNSRYDFDGVKVANALTELTKT